jgi:hypothetical protein
MNRQVAKALMARTRRLIPLDRGFSWRLGVLAVTVRPRREPRMMPIPNVIAPASPSYGCPQGAADIAPRRGVTVHAGKLSKLRARGKAAIWSRIDRRFGDRTAREGVQHVDDQRDRGVMRLGGGLQR